MIRLGTNDCWENGFDDLEATDTDHGDNYENHFMTRSETL